MALRRKIDLPRWQARIKPLLLPGLVGLVLLYTADQLLTGERGIVTWRVMKQQNADLEAQIAALQRDISVLENHIARLKGPGQGREKGRPERDFLDELARRELGLVRPGEKVILRQDFGL